jgi:hypothetical protein
LGVVWTFAHFEPMFEFNLGTVMIPVILPIIFNLVVYFDLKSPIFAFMVSLIVLYAILVMAIGWNTNIFIIGGIATTLLWLGTHLDNNRNIPGVVGFYSFLFLFLSILLGVGLAISQMT